MRDVVTTAFEVAGLSALAVSAGLAGWTYVAPAAGFGAAGALLVGFAYAIVRRGGDR